MGAQVSTKIDFDLKGVGYLLKVEILQVPLYQRSYSWGTDQVNDFCSDIKNAFGSSQREHFMGTVVLSSEEGARLTIIDGQQRLATTTLFLVAMRDYYEEHGEIARANAINSEYLNMFSDEEGAHVPKLVLNAEDDHFFRQFVVPDAEAVGATRDSHRLLENANEKIRSFVQEQAEQAGTNWVDTFVQWRKFIESGLRVIYVKVPSESDAFMIFETLNDRGANLTLSDLLKNYLFGRASKQANGLEIVRDKWLVAFGALDADQDLFIAYLRHLWNSKRGATREAYLYKQIKSHVTTATQAMELATEIESGAGVYAALLSSDDDYWSAWGKSTRLNIETLNLLALGQIRPMLLAVLQHFTMKEAKRVLRLSVNWGVRGLIVGGIGGGSTEKAYCDAAVAVRKGEVKTAEELLSKLETIIPSDAEFESAFSSVRVLKASLSRYYLRALEAQRSGEAEPEFVANPDEAEINLEHVLPKKATEADWPAFPGDLGKQWVDRLGNHALLQKVPNDLIGNRPFSVKKPVLASSNYELTKEIGSQADWTASEIEKRQAELASEASATWPRMI